MNNKRKEEDFLGSLFEQLPQEELPASFRQAMMQKVFRETVRIRKRNERCSLASVIVASCLMIGLAVFVFIRLDLDQLSFNFPDISFVPFYIYIGVLAFILLGIDHWIRQLYKKKHQKDIL